MPRKKKNGARVESTRDDQVITRGSSGRGQRRSLEATPHSARGVRTQSGDREVTTRTAAKRKNAGQTPSRGKRQRRSESRADTEAEDTPLTRADIPTIVNAVLSNITTDSAGAGGETEDTLDNAPIGK